MSQVDDSNLDELENGKRALENALLKVYSNWLKSADVARRRKAVSGLCRLDPTVIIPTSESGQCSADDDSKGQEMPLQGWHNNLPTERSR